MNKKITFFSPHSAIWAMSLPEAKLINYLKENFEIDVIYCNADFKAYCSAMSAYGLSQEDSEESKQNVCLECIRKQNILKELNPKANYINIEQLVDSDSKEKAKFLSETLSMDEIFRYKDEDIELGIFSQYELLLQYKKFKLEYSQKEERSGRIAFYNTLISREAAKKYFNSNNVNKLVMYNFLYSVNSAWKKTAESKNIDTYFLNAGENLYERLNTLIIGKDQFYRPIISKTLNLHENTPIFSEQFKDKIVSHFKELFFGKHFFVYSSTISNTDIFEFFRLSRDKKIVLVAMSSNDERFSSEVIGYFKKPTHLLFPDQFSWAKELIEYFKDKPNYQLILRMHPREFPNKRDSLRSEQSVIFEQLFKDLPPNVVINYPTDNISIYEIAMHSDCILTAWSSVGEELALFGLPVLTYSREMIAYHTALNYLAEDKELYFQKIEELLDSPDIHLEKMEMAMRWYGLKFSAPVDLFYQFQLTENPDFLPKVKQNKIKRLRFRSLIHKLIKKFQLNLKEIIDIYDFYINRKDKKRVINFFKENLFNSLENYPVIKVTKKQEKENIHETLTILIDLLTKMNPSLKFSRHIQKLNRLYLFDKKSDSKIFDFFRKKKVIIGSGGIELSWMKNWIKTDKENLNILDESDYRKLFQREGSIQSFFSEHVFEHLHYNEIIQAIILIKKYLKKNGSLRIAVPDGLFPDQEYIDYVKPGGSGAGSDDHKVLLTFLDALDIGEKVGMTVELIEYWDKSGKFQKIRNMDIAKGIVERSLLNDSRNTKDSIKYTSLIFDLIKVD